MFDMSPFYFGWYLVAFVLASRRWTLSVFCTKWSRRHLREPCLLRKASCCWSPAVVESCSRAALYAGCDTNRRLAGIFSEWWVRLTRRNCPMQGVHISSEVAAPACPAQNVVCLGLRWTLTLPTKHAESRLQIPVRWTELLFFLRGLVQFVSRQWCHSACEYIQLIWGCL
jgi:hypothetical protein